MLLSLSIVIVRIDLQSSVKQIWKVRAFLLDSIKPEGHKILTMDEAKKVIGADYSTK